MSTAIESAPLREDTLPKYYYGCREVVRHRDDGTSYLEMVPLTLEDTIHPQLGDHLMEGPMHDATRSYLTLVFRSRLADDPTAFVLSDCGVDFDDVRFPELLCPDVAVVTGLERPNNILLENSYSVAKFGKRRRSAIVEVVSRHTRNNDVSVKFNAYHKLKIPLYVIVDRVKSDVDWSIVAYQYTPKRYFHLANDDRGRFWIDFLNIWLGVENEKVVCYDGNSDAVLGDYVEIFQQLQAENQRAEAEKQRAEAEKQRADAERQAREAAEMKTRELEAELARIRGK